MKKLKNNRITTLRSSIKKTLDKSLLQKLVNSTILRIKKIRSKTIKASLTLQRIKQRRNWMINKGTPLKMSQMKYPRARVTGANNCPRKWSLSSWPLIKSCSFNILAVLFSKELPTIRKIIFKNRFIKQRPRFKLHQIKTWH